MVKNTEKGNILKQAFNAFLASIKDDSLVLNPYKISRIKKLHDVGEGFHAYQAIRELAKFNAEREAFISGSESNYKYDAHFVTEADGITSGMMIFMLPGAVRVRPSQRVWKILNLSIQM